MGKNINDFAMEALTRYSDPTNDNANGTQFEHDPLSTQLRHGGDIKGLENTLDYLQGMGIRTLYLAGSPMINFPWASDGYSPLDLTLLDRHFGDINAWRNAIAEIHSRGMYVVLDNTFATLGDLLGFAGHLNSSAAFNPSEYDAVWKSDRRYADFQQSNAKIGKCDYPRFWGDDGMPVDTSQILIGCRDSEFDQYGEVASDGDDPEYVRQLSKFSSVQDRLREWRGDVLAKIQHFSCLTLSMLDIDGFRIDKAIQVTVDSQGAWSSFMRQCARDHGKNNFYITGEVSSSNTFGSIYIGKGMQPDMAFTNITEAITATNSTTRKYIRDQDNSALDASAFHYTVYRALSNFLSMEGQGTLPGEPSYRFVDLWNSLLETNDFVNANTGKFDPRHMFGTANQDTFRLPAVANGTEKQMLGLFITTLLLPGIPALYWGEEQALYILENTNDNYVFGRQPISSSQAWQMHGCYKVGTTQESSFPLGDCLTGCEDNGVSLDHRDPSHPIRNIIKRMYELREIFPALNDGFDLRQLSNHTIETPIPNSSDVQETGLWSAYRGPFTGVQSFEGIGQGDQAVWLLYTNENKTVEYDFDCASEDNSLIAPFGAGVVVQNLFPPHEEYTLTTGPVSLNLNNLSTSGCLANISMPAWSFKALVPMDQITIPKPVITEFSPGHDARILSNNNDTGETVHIKIGFSAEMGCSNISDSITINSTTVTGGPATVDASTATCSTVVPQPGRWIGEATTAFTWDADLTGVHHGVHWITVSNPGSVDGIGTNETAHFMIRVGDLGNPIVFPQVANYSTTLLAENKGNLTVSHNAAGADLWRYSLNFGTTFSDWTAYEGGSSTLAHRVWNGTKAQAWSGQHVIVQYWSSLTGSSAHIQHGDIGSSPRQFPNLFVEGAFNQFGYDTGVPNKMRHESNATWSLDLLLEWPAAVSLNAWGLNPDGQLDKTRTFGDVDGDNVLDRIPPQSLLTNTINLNKTPPSPFLAHNVKLNDANLRYELIPSGSRWLQLLLYILLATIPVLTATASYFAYTGAFYRVKFNKYGVQARSVLPVSFRQKFLRLHSTERLHDFAIVSHHSRPTSPMPSPGLSRGRNPVRFTDEDQVLNAAAGGQRRVVLIATMEYDIEDWAIKIKIGGLGVMAQLMGKNLGHQDLIWVVPKVGDVEYPDAPNEVGEPMRVTVLGEQYEIGVQVHYVLLDAPVFRAQKKAEPYPPRMDDLDSAVYYSAWNACIAEAIRRYQPDLYHINDYHGSAAPLYLLPQTIPCCLSLHNAEFQGLWPMRSEREREEVCKIYNLGKASRSRAIFTPTNCTRRSEDRPGIRPIRRSLQSPPCRRQLPPCASERFRRCRCLEEIRQALIRPLSYFLGPQRDWFAPESGSKRYR